MADAEQTLRKLLEEILDEMNYKPRETEIKAVESGGANFTSVLFFVNVSSPNREDLKIFAKVACVGEEMRNTMIGDWLYDTERLVYTKLIKVYKDIENKMNVPDEHKFRFPKLYGYNAEIGRETVVMENLVESGYQSFNRFESLDWAHASAGIENLAKFHALSFAYAKHHPEEFEKVLKKLAELKFGTVSESQNKNSKYLWQKSVLCSLAAVEQDLHGRILKVMEDCAEDPAKYNRPIGQPVIVHGDYKCSNILFRKQVIRSGNPVVNQILNMADAEQTLRKLLEEILDEMNYKPREIEIKAVESGGANFTSVLFFVNVSFPNREDLKIFAKVACVGEEMRNTMIGDWLYDTERLVYTKLIKVYKDIENKMNVPDEHKFRFPKLYGYNAEIGRETVVMENLVESGYQSFNRFESLDWAHASAGIENLAKFHALSFAYAKHHPEEFEKVLKKLAELKFGTVSESQNKNSKYLWQKSVLCSLAAVEQDLHGRILKVMEDCAEDPAKYNRPIGQPVIVHGDYKCSNILFRKQGVIVDAVSIDYQTVYAGNPVLDIIYFIVLSTDEEFRRQYYDELLAHYYTKLEEALRRLSVDPSEIYPRDKYYSDLKKVLSYAVVLAAVVLPMITAEGDSIPKVDGDVKDFIPTPNEMSAQRFRGVVNDCVKWGAI